MSALSLPRRFQAQPWNTLEVDWSHPAFTGRRAIVIVGGVPFSRGLGEPDFLVEAPTGSARVDASAKGLAWHGTGSGTRVNLARSLGTQTSALVILGSGVIRSARAADNNYFGYYNIGAGSCQFGTGGSPSASSRRSWSWVGGYAACVVPHATSMSTAPMVYVDGARCVPTDSGGTGTTINWGSASDVRYNVGYDPGNPTVSQNDRVVLAVFFSGALSDALAKSLSENPRQLFKPCRQVLYFDVGGGTGATDLTIQDSSHAQAADNAGLTTQWLLTVADAAHAHTADGPTLTVASVLAVAEALHTHVADNLDLSTTGATNLTIQEAAHDHTADALTLITDWLLTIADALHSHAADNLGLTADTWLAIADAVHAHLADGVTLTTASVLAILEAVHAHAAEVLDLFFSSFTEAQLQEILAYVEANMAVPTAAQIAAAVWAEVLEGTLTAAQMQRIKLAALAGKRKGLGTATEEYLGLDGVTPRVTFTPADASGNGTTVVDGA